MGRVLVHMSISVDGFFEGPDADISWHRVDAEVHGFVNDLLRPVPTYLSGRRNYELMQSFWPTADQDPDAPPEIVDFAGIWRAAHKYVASRTLTEVADGDVLVREVDADLVTALAERGDVVVGAADLAGHVLRLGLVGGRHVQVLAPREHRAVRQRHHGVPRAARDGAQRRGPVEGQQRRLVHDGPHCPVAQLSSCIVSP